MDTNNIYILSLFYFLCVRLPMLINLGHYHLKFRMFDGLHTSIIYYSCDTILTCIFALFLYYKIMYNDKFDAMQIIILVIFGLYSWNITVTWVFLCTFLSALFWIWPLTCLILVCVRCITVWCNKRRRIRPIKYSSAIHFLAKANHKLDISDKKHDCCICLDEVRFNFNVYLA